MGWLGLRGQQGEGAGDGGSAPLAPPAVTSLACGGAAPGEASQWLAPEKDFASP